MPRKQSGELTPTQLKLRNAKKRDAIFRDFIQRPDVIEEAAILKKSKRIGHMKERFERETGYHIPLSMVYKNYNKVHPKQDQPSIDSTADATDDVTPDEPTINESPNRFDSDSTSARGSDESDGIVIV